MEEIISISCGNGGKYTSRIIEQEILPYLGNEILCELGDSANLNIDGQVAFSTDSFVISPIVFHGGDIGKLSVCGTVNDLLVSGAIPKYLSLSFIVEEGTKLSLLRQVVESIGKTCKKANVKVVTGDFKVVEKGKGDGIYINTAGIGKKVNNLSLGVNKIKTGDKVIVTGNIGDHGISLFCLRNNVFNNEILSDCNVLNNIMDIVFKFKDQIKIMRDPTRGGLATTLNEFVENEEFSIEILEERIPYNIKSKTAAEILGLDLLYSPCEGRAIIICKNECAEDLLNKLRNIKDGEDSQIIGEVVNYTKSKVLLKSTLGGRRILDKLTSDQLPRIC